MLPEITTQFQRLVPTHEARFRVWPHVVAGWSRCHLAIEAIDATRFAPHFFNTSVELCISPLHPSAKVCCPIPSRKRTWLATSRATACSPLTPRVTSSRSRRRSDSGNVTMPWSRSSWPSFVRLCARRRAEQDRAADHAAQLHPADDGLVRHGARK